MLIRGDIIASCVSCAVENLNPTIMNCMCAFIVVFTLIITVCIISASSYMDHVQHVAQCSTDTHLDNRSIATKTNISLLPV